MLQETGTFRGERVQVIAADGLALDGVEEISMHFSEEVEDKQVATEHLQEEYDPVLMPAEEVMAYLDSAHLHEDAERTVMLAKLMRGGGSRPGALAQSAFEDGTRRHLALQLALGDALREGDSADIVHELREALADLDDEQGPEIRARLNTIGVASDVGTDAGSVAVFQSTYVDIVLGHGKLAQTLLAALSRFGSQGFELGLRRLISALGLDLSAAAPSTSPERLRALVQDMYQLQVVNTVLAGASRLADRLHQQYAVERFTPHELVRELVELTGERWSGAERFLSMASRYVQELLSARATFLVGVRTLLTDFPPGVYADKDAREQMLGSAQTALDEVVEREEEQQERQGESGHEEECASDEARQEDHDAEGASDTTRNDTQGLA